MAIRREVVENKMAVQYHGITVYHTHQGDDFFNPTNEYIFSLDPFGSETDVGNGSVFDIRQLRGYTDSANVYQNLLAAIDDELLGETNIIQREAGVAEYVSINDDADEHHCPVCNAYLPCEGEEVWDGGELTSDGTFYEYACHCPQCGAKFKQVYRLGFDGYDIE